MTPQPPLRDQPNPLPIVGAIVGVVLGVALGGGGTLAYSRWSGGQARRGWSLIPVLVVTRDLARGATLTRNDLESRSVPEQFVTASNVKPSSLSSLIDQPLQLPIAAGEPLRRAHLGTWPAPLEPLADAAAIEACREVAARYPSKVESLGQIRERLERAR